MELVVCSLCSVWSCVQFVLCLELLLAAYAQRVSESESESKRERESERERERERSLSSTGAREVCVYEHCACSN